MKFRVSPDFDRYVTICLAADCRSDKVTAEQWCDRVEHDKARFLSRVLPIIRWSSWQRHSNITMMLRTGRKWMWRPWGNWTYNTVYLLVSCKSLVTTCHKQPPLWQQRSSLQSQSTHLMISPTINPVVSVRPFCVCRNPLSCCLRTVSYLRRCLWEHVLMQREEEVCVCMCSVSQTVQAGDCSHVEVSNTTGLLTVLFCLCTNALLCLMWQTSETETCSHLVVSSSLSISEEDLLW